MIKHYKVKISGQNSPPNISDDELNDQPFYNFKMRDNRERLGKIKNKNQVILMMLTLGASTAV